MKVILLHDHNDKISKIQFPLKCIDYLVYDRDAYLLCESENKNKFIIMVRFNHLFMTGRFSDKCDLKEETFNFNSGSYNTFLFFEYYNLPWSDSETPLKLEVDNIKEILGETICEARFYFEGNSQIKLKLELILQNKKIINFFSTFEGNYDGLYSSLIIVPV